VTDGLHHSGKSPMAIRNIVSMGRQDLLILKQSKAECKQVGMIMVIYAPQDWWNTDELGPLCIVSQVFLGFLHCVFELHHCSALPD